MKLKDQNFKVGDRVVVIGSGLQIFRRTIIKVYKDGGSSGVGVGLNCQIYMNTGQSGPNMPQSVFHEDAVTIDEYDRLLSIDYDYIKENAPIATKEPH